MHVAVANRVVRRGRTLGRGSLRAGRAGRAVRCRRRFARSDSWIVLDARFSAVRSLVGAALVAGAFSALWHDQAADVPNSAVHTRRFACTVLGDVQSTGASSSFVCLLGDGRAVLVELSGNAPGIAQRVELRGRLEPFDGARNPGEPDQAAIERERGLYAQIAAAHLLRRLPAGPISYRVVVALMHAWALEQFRSRLPEPSASILAGELWGEKTTLPPDLRPEFQETGTVHVLVTRACS